MQFDSITTFRVGVPLTFPAPDPHRVDLVYRLHKFERPVAQLSLSDHGPLKDGEPVSQDGVAKRAIALGVVVTGGRRPALSAGESFQAVDGHPVHRPLPRLIIDQSMVSAGWADVQQRLSKGRQWVKFSSSRAGMTAALVGAAVTVFAAAVLYHLAALWSAQGIEADEHQTGGEIPGVQLWGAAG